MKIVYESEKFKITLENEMYYIYPILIDKFGNKYYQYSTTISKHCTTFELYKELFKEEIK